MKKTIIKILTILFSIVLLLSVYRLSAVDIHLNTQVKAVCNWLNDNTEVQPRVGPLAKTKLAYLKNKYEGGFDCKIEESPHKYGYSDEKAIVIYREGVNKLGLVFGFSYGGVKNYFRARYYQLWTPKDSGEDGLERLKRPR